MKTIARLRVVSVDMDGFQGREHHPKPEDVGTVVHVLGMHLEPLDGADDETGETSIEDSIGVWSCERQDGTLIDLVDFEVELAEAV